MAYYELSPSAPGRQTPLGLKANLVSALNAAKQIQRESAEMTETQIQSHFGFSGTQAAWNATIDGVVTALEAAAVDNLISQIGAG
jgi:hypothetical protein